MPRFLSLEESLKKVLVSWAQKKIDVVLEDSVEDATGTILVKVWGMSCSELFRMTVDKLRAMWEDGLDNTSIREDLLKSLNREFGLTHRMLCGVTVLVYGLQNGALGEHAFEYG